MGAPDAGAGAALPAGLAASTASPPNIPYSNLDARSGKYLRVFNDATSVVGKPDGLRATEWSYDEFCGQTSANGQVYGAAAGGVAAGLAGKVLDDMGGLITAVVVAAAAAGRGALLVEP